MKRILIRISAVMYHNILKPLFFLRDPELVHHRITSMGEGLGNVKPFTKVMKSVFQNTDLIIKQSFCGIDFSSPIGLSAGFDYEARLTQILPAVGFGFQSVGTITNLPYEGNPKPMLGRLPKSKSLMVNKGFKNPGAKSIVEKLTPLGFDIPVGVSIGRTNSLELATQIQSVGDIVQAFTLFEQSTVKHSYYELNISCPNLYGDVTFYPPQNLDELLTEVDRLNLKRPVFVKMPIEKDDQSVLDMLEVIAKHSPQGVIFGNLQKDRSDPALDPEEVKKFKVGNFSGKPTYKRSNELIKLAYQNYKNRLLIIGCGGVFSADDAYEKIKLGASLVQLITGLVFEGPLLAVDINTQLTEKLKKDGFTHISQAVGVNAS